MSKNKRSEEAKFRQIIQLPLTEDDLEKVVAWELKPEHVDDAIKELCELGYSVSFSYDPLPEQWTVSISGKWRHCPNAGLVLYGNGRTYEGARSSALYKALVKGEGENWETLDTQTDRGDIW